jgi:hypothetical protein
MLASITPINFLLKEVLICYVVPKYLNCDTFSKHLLATLCHAFAMHSGDETATFSFLCVYF